MNILRELLGEVKPNNIELKMWGFVFLWNENVKLVIFWNENVKLGLFFWKENVMNSTPIKHGKKWNWKCEEMKLVFFKWKCIVFTCSGVTPHVVQGRSHRLTARWHHKILDSSLVSKDHLFGHVICGVVMCNTSTCMCLPRDILAFIVCR